MQVAKMLKVLLLGLVVVWVTGCATGGGGEDAEAAAARAAEEAAAAEAYRAEEQARLEAQAMEAEEAARVEAEQQRLMAITTFYFDFDQSVVKPEARAALEAHAQYLAANGGNVVLEGHADERGTREYNLALGERRAEAIARYLSVLGVSAQQIESVSYGEERPASLGHDESSWSLNRRVELRYGN